jgi:hypothetical protein
LISRSFSIIHKRVRESINDDFALSEIPLSNKKPQQIPPVSKKTPPKPTKLEDQSILENLADLLTQRQRKDSLPRPEAEIFSATIFVFQIGRSSLKRSLKAGKKIPQRDYTALADLRPEQRRRRCLDFLC